MPTNAMGRESNKSGAAGAGKSGGLGGRSNADRDREAGRALSESMRGSGQSGGGRGYRDLIGKLTGYQQTQIKTGKAQPKISRQYEATPSNLAKVGAIAAGTLAGPAATAVGGALAGPVGQALGSMVGQAVSVGKAIGGAYDIATDPAGALNPFEGYKGDVPGTTGMGTGEQGRSMGRENPMLTPVTPSPTPAPITPAPQPKPGLNEGDEGRGALGPSAGQNEAKKPKKPEKKPGYTLLEGAGGTLLGS